MIALPLERSMIRCLAYGLRVGETCPRADDCARHVTIRHDLSPVPPNYRACGTDQYSLYIPLAGFPPRDAEEA